MAISSVLFVNQKGEVIISRHYRDASSSKQIAELFRTQVIGSKEVCVRAPARMKDCLPHQAKKSFGREMPLTFTSLSFSSRSPAFRAVGRLRAVERDTRRR